MQLFRFLKVITTNLKKWYIFLVALSTLIVVYILQSDLPSLFVLSVSALWIIPLYLIFIDSMILYDKRELVPIVVGSLIFILLGFAGICTLMCLDKWPGFFLPIHSTCYIIACLLSIVSNMILVVRKPPWIFAASSRMVVLLCTIYLHVRMHFGVSAALHYVWDIPVYFVAPALGIIHNMQLLLRKKAKKPLLSIIVVCLLSIPLIIGAIYIWTLYLPSNFIIEKLNLYGKWLEWHINWD